MFGSKIKCRVLKKKLSKKTAKNCEYFTAGAAPAGFTGAEHAKKILSVNYQPSCDDCSNNDAFKIF